MYTKYSIYQTFISNVMNSISNPIVHYSLFNTVPGKVHPHIQHIYQIPTTNYQIPLPCHVRPLKSHRASACHSSGRPPVSYPVIPVLSFFSFFFSENFSLFTLVHCRSILSLIIIRLTFGLQRTAFKVEQESFDRRISTAVRQTPLSGGCWIVT